MSHHKQKKAEKQTTAAAASRRHPVSKGGGGRHNWGVAGVADVLDDAEFAAEFLHGDGPDGDGDDESNVRFDVVALDPQESFKASCHDALVEFFSSAEQDELVLALHALGEPHWAYEFVNRALLAAVARGNREREQVSRLLSTLFGTVLSPAMIRAGFNLALDRLADLELDVPDAVDVLGAFVARAVHDDILPPVFTQAHAHNFGHPRTADPRADALANAALQRAQSLLADGGERVESVWGPAAAQSVAKLKEALAVLVREFLDSGDHREVERSLLELHLKPFHFQLVKLVVDLYLESTKPNDRQMLFDLLVALARQGALTPAALRIGFQISVDNVAELATDIAVEAPQSLLALIDLATAHQLLDADFAAAAKQLVPVRIEEAKQRRAAYRLILKKSATSS